MKVNKLKQADPDFYFEHLYENPDEHHDMAQTKSRFKPEEIAKLKKSHDYWENARLKVYSERLKQVKRKRSCESFEYLL